MTDLEAYAGSTSVQPGESIMIHARTTGEERECRVRFYRCPKSPHKGQALEPDPVLQNSSMMVTQANVPEDAPQNGCGWNRTSFIVGDWRSGLYMARIGNDDLNSTDVFFVVRRPVPTPGSPPRSPILVMMPFTTIQAYNPWGGGNFYGPEEGEVLPQVVPKVSFLRPTDYFSVLDKGKGYLRFLLEWLDRNQERGSIPECDYISDIDLAQGNYSIRPSSYKLIISAGHDEYWSDIMFDNMLNYVWTGGNVAFLGANTCDGRVTFPEGYQTMFFRQGDRWRQYESKDALLVGLRTPLGDANDPNGPEKPNKQTNYTGPYALLEPNHWVLNGVHDSNFGVLTGGTNIVGYEISSALPRTPKEFKDKGVKDFQILGVAPYNAFVNTHFGIFQNITGMVFSAGTINWTLGLAEEEEGRGVDRVTLNVVQRLSS
jgi:hypothetical protein